MATAAADPEGEAGATTTTSATTTATATATDAAAGPRRVWLYSSAQRVLTVGDGNFTFSRTLARRLQSGPRLVASSYDTETEVLDTYKCGETLAELAALGAATCHGVDATNLQATLLPQLAALGWAAAVARHRCPSTEGGAPGPRPTDIEGGADGAEAPTNTAAAGTADGEVRFDRIVFQFPLCRRKESVEEHRKDPNEAIRNKRLLALFLRSAWPLLAEDGEVHITSKIGKPYSGWRIEALASPPLALHSIVRFDPSELDGYEVRVVGCDIDFPVSSTRALTYIYKHEAAVTDDDRLKLRHILSIQAKGLIPDSFEMDPDPSTLKRKRTFDCDLCYCTCSEQSHLEQHRESKRHRRIVALESKWQAELLRLGTQSSA